MSRRKRKQTSELSRLKYDAAEPSPLRRAPVVSSKPADRELTPLQRQMILSQLREQQGNFSLASFLLDKHIEYMASYKFQCKTPYPEFNKAVEERFKKWKRRINCEVQEEFGFEELLQLIELHRTTDGDVLIVKHTTGQIQVIEGDRVRNPTVINASEKWYHGIRTNDYGKKLAYAVSRRLEHGGFEHEKFISAKNAWLLGYRRRVSQKRGVSPLSPVVNQLKMLYATYEYAAAKQQLMQLLGIVAKRDEPDQSLTQEEIATQDEKFHDSLQEKFGPGVSIVSVNKGEDVVPFESNMPGGDTQNFWGSMIRQILLSLHIPYSFYDGSEVNYYGAEGELNQYLNSCYSRQLPMIEWIRELIEWLVGIWVEDKEIELPTDPTTGKKIELECLSECFKVTNSGMPFFVLLKVIKDAQAAVMTGAISPQEFANQFGHDYEENTIAIAEAIEFARKQGVTMAFDTDKVNLNLGL